MESFIKLEIKILMKFIKKIIAIKKIRMENCDEGVPSTAIREIALIKDANHPNIVHLKEIIHNQDKLWLIFEYCDYDLRKYMNHFGVLSPSLVKVLLI